MYVLLCWCKVHHFSRFPATKISAVLDVAHAHCLIAIAGLTKRSASHTKQAERANTKNPFNRKLLGWASPERAIKGEKLFGIQLIEQFNYTENN